MTTAHTEIYSDRGHTVEELVANATAIAGSLAATDLVTRSALLHSIADALDADREFLVNIADHETGLGVARLGGEVARTSSQLRLFAEVVQEGSWIEAIIDRAEPSAGPPRPDLRRMLVPIGPVAVFAASNFPFAFSVAGGDTAAALAAGCPVIVKAHPGHPQLSERTAEIVRAGLASAGAPTGAFGLVQGLEAGRALVEHPGIRAAAFTGSLRAGRLLFDLANARPDPIPFYGELGSINPVIVGPVRDEAAARVIASGLIGSFTLGQGQFCTKPGLVFLPSGTQIPAIIADELTAQGARLLTTSIASSFDAGIAAIEAVAGVRVVARGRTGNPDSSGRVPAAPPTVFAADVATAMASRDVLLEECFGPTTLLVEYESADEISRALELMPGALTASIHAAEQDLAELSDLIALLRDRAGRVIFNAWPTGVAVTWSMQHGGPWPSTTCPLFTSVGATAIRRFLRPITYQAAPQQVLPPALRDGNPWRIPVRRDGVLRYPAAGA